MAISFNVCRRCNSALVMHYMVRLWDNAVDDPGNITCWFNITYIKLEPYGQWIPYEKWYTKSTYNRITVTTLTIPDNPLYVIQCDFGAKSKCVIFQTSRKYGLRPRDPRQYFFICTVVYPVSFHLEIVKESEMTNMSHMPITVPNGSYVPTESR